MAIADSSETPVADSSVRLEGKYSAIAVCWVLGLGSLVAWNSMLTIGDYYYELFPKENMASGSMVESNEFEGFKASNVIVESTMRARMENAISWDGAKL